MQSEKKGGLTSLTDFSNLIRKDSIDDDVFVFDDISDAKINAAPIKIEMPVFAVCTQGCAKMEINLKEYDVNQNTLITLMPDHILHGYKHSADFNGLFIAVSNRCVDELLPDIHTALPMIMSFRSTPVVNLEEEEVDMYKKMHAFLGQIIRSNVGVYKRKVVNGLLQSMLYLTLSIYKTRYKYATVKRSRNEDIFFNFLTLLEHSFKESRTVQDYANRLCITPKHLSMVVKSVSGRTAGMWIDGYVILAAKVLLRSSSRTIQEISVELNFPNQSFFGKFFKQHVGVSPREYRMQGI